MSQTNSEVNAVAAGKRGEEAGKGREAFTLIELLTVIAIIAVLAGLVVPLAGLASTKMKVARVSAELNNYVNAIENYKSRLNYYPPDNKEKLRQAVVSGNEDDYRRAAAMNPLFYELSGTIFTNTSDPRVGMFTTASGNESISSTVLFANFGVDGIQNSARDARDIPFKGFSLKASQYKELEGPNDVELLAVPVAKGPFILKAKGPNSSTYPFNPWFYDASSTNRHNRESFDLWAEYSVGKKIVKIGNWKD